MKTCSQCKRSYPDAQLSCAICAIRLPEGEAAALANVAHIDFLLTELPIWVRNGSIQPEQANKLREEYRRRRDALRFPNAGITFGADLSGNPEAAAGATGVGRMPPDEYDNHPSQQNRPSSQNWPRGGETEPDPARADSAQAASPFSAFLEQKNISYWHLIGSMLLLAGLAGLVRWTWGGIGKNLVFGLLLSLTGGLYALARSRFVREQQIAALVLTAIAALLVPLDIIAANAFRLFGTSLPTNQIGLIASVICLPVYLWLVRNEKSVCFTALLIAAITAVAHFGLQMTLPRVLHTTAVMPVLAAYGFVTIPLAALYVLVGLRTRDAQRRATWLMAAHITVAASLFLALWDQGPTTIGNLATDLLLTALLYGAIAWLFDVGAYALLSSALTVLASFIMLDRYKVDYTTQWYVYVLAGLAIAVASRALETLFSQQGRLAAARAYGDTSLIIARLALVVQAIWALSETGTFPQFHVPQAELLGAAACAGASYVLFLWFGSRRVIDFILGYLCVLTGLTIAHFAPPDSLLNAQHNVSLYLAIAAGMVTWPLRRRTSTIGLGGASLAMALLYIAHGGYFASTNIALLLLLTIFTADIMAARAGELVKAVDYEILAAAGTATTLVCLWESRALPVLFTRFHWEQNYGYGLFILTLAIIALGRLWRSQSPDDADNPIFFRSAAIIAVSNILLQWVYTTPASGSSGSTEFPYSPLVLLGLGMLIAGIVGLRWKSRVGAAVAVGLAVCAYIVYQIPRFDTQPMDLRGRDILIVVILLTGAALFIRLAQKQQRIYLAYAAAFTLVLGLCEGLHYTARHAPAIVYTLALFPVVSMYYALSFKLRDKRAALWKTPLQLTALVISLFALSPIADSFMDPIVGIRGIQIVSALLGYGLLYATVAWVQRETLTIYLFATAFDAAYLYVLLHQHHALPQTVAAFAFSLAALVWLTMATLWARFAPRDRLPAAMPFYCTGAVTALVSIAMAVVGLESGAAPYFIYTLLVAGTAFLGISAGTRNNWWMHIGVIAYLAAYFAYLTSRLVNPGLPDSDFYLVPVGVYVLFLGLLAKRRAPDTDCHPFYLAGLLLVLTPTFVSAWQTHAAPLHALLLATECVAAIYYGISARIKVFVGGGTAFLIALIVLEEQGSMLHLHWSVYATLLGIVIIASALYFEKRRDSVIKWTKSVQERLKEWD